MSGLDPSWSVPESPPFSKLFSLRYILALSVSFLFFRWASSVVKRCLWNDYKGSYFKQYRLRNLTICLLHSCLSGTWVFLFAITHAEVMLTDPVFYYKPWMKIIVLITVGYFIHDALDMLQYEWSRWTVELLLHHFATGFVMSVAICGEKFTVYAYQSLLMEVNSIFLHIRTLFQLSGASNTHPKLFTAIKYLNILTFLIFRFAVQCFQLHFVVVWREHYHFFYFACGFFGGILFLATNMLLFFRVLAADGFLPDVLKRHLAFNRDEQKNIKKA